MVERQLAQCKGQELAVRRTLIRSIAIYNVLADVELYTVEFLCATTFGRWPPSISDHLPKTPKMFSGDKLERDNLFYLLFTFLFGFVSKQFYYCVY